MKSIVYALACAIPLAAAAPVALAQLKLPGEQKGPSLRTAPPKPAAAEKGPSKPAAGKPAPASEDPLGKHIEERFKRFGGWTLCIVEDTPVAEIRAAVVEEAKKRGGGSSLTPAEADVALLTRYPCPFSPYRAELQPATAKDLEGVWLFPSPSQPYRYGPKSPDQPGGAAQVIKCEIVGFYAGGEFRNGLVRGEGDCPFSKAADLQPARAAPRSISWGVPADGLLRITQANATDAFQEWEIFTVKSAFGMHAMDFKEGDVLAFLRKEKGNEVNASTEFRHLQRLP